jgi:fumarate reductase subunit C
MMADQTITRVAPLRTEAYLDVLQMLTGLGLAAFMMAHTVLVASVNFDLGGGRVMNAIGGFFETTYMAQIGGPLIALTMIAHFVLAARKLPFRAREQRAIWNHSVSFNQTDTWLWMIQATTAFLILIMGSIHVWTVLTDLPISASKAAALLRNFWWLALYVVLIPLIQLHLWIGLYKIGVKWGFIKRSNRAMIYSILVKLTLIMIAIGYVTLFTFRAFVKV